MIAIHWKQGTTAKSLLMRSQPFRDQNHLRTWARSEGIRGTVRVFCDREIVLQVVA